MFRSASKFLFTKTDVIALNGEIFLWALISYVVCVQPPQSSLMDLIDPALEGPADQTSDPWGAGAAAAGPASDPWQSYGKETHKRRLDNISQIVNIMMFIKHFWLEIMFPKEYVNRLVHLGLVNLNFFI